MGVRSREPLIRIALVSVVADPTHETPEAVLRSFWHVPCLADALAARGHAVTVIQAFRTHARLRRGSVDILMTGVDGIARQLAELRPEVVHIFGLTLVGPIAAIAPAAKGIGAKLSASFHGGAPRRNPFARARQRRALAGLTAVFFPATAHSEIWRRAGILGPATRVVIAPEVSSALTPVDRDEAKARLGVTSGPLLAWSARLHPVKDPLTTLRGFELLAHRRDGARLLMAFRSRELLQGVTDFIAARPALRERIELLGEWPHERMALLFSAADFFVQSSIQEYGGNSLVEAMSCGAVPVVTDIPSFRVLTDDGRCALLFPPGDAAAMSLAIDGIGEPERRALAARVRMRFDTELSYPALARVFETSLAGADRPA